MIKCDKLDKRMLINIPVAFFQITVGDGVPLAMHSKVTFLPTTVSILWGCFFQLGGPKEKTINKFKNVSKIIKVLSGCF